MAVTSQPFRILSRGQFHNLLNEILQGRTVFFHLHQNKRNTDTLLYFQQGDWQEFIGSPSNYLSVSVSVWRIPCFIAPVYFHLHSTHRSAHLCLVKEENVVLFRGRQSKVSPSSLTVTQNDFLSRTAVSFYRSGQVVTYGPLLLFPGINMSMVYGNVIY